VLDWNGRVQGGETTFFKTEEKRQQHIEFLKKLKNYINKL
jgi:hypothetical protein